MTDYFEDFRLNVKHYREKKGWNQSQLAVQADSSNGMIGNIESGKARPSFANIIAIATALGVHPADLFLRDSSKMHDRAAISKHLDTIKSLEKMPDDVSAAICKMICEIGCLHREKK